MSKLRISSNDECCSRKSWLCGLSRTNTKTRRLSKKQRGVDRQYRDNESFEDIETTKVLFKEALRWAIETMKNVETEDIV